MPENVSFFWSFAAGFLSFLSPCVLPLIPGYLSFISGLSVQEIKENSSWKILGPTLLFTAGFSLIFIMLGASASLIGQLLATYKGILTKVAGVLIIFFGLSVTGVFKIPFFAGQRGTLSRANPPKGPLVLLLGVAFAFAWTPCIGPILTSILLFAGTASTIKSGVFLLAAYSLGLAIPFILSGLLLNRFMRAFEGIKRHYRLVTAVSGFLLITMGILLISNQIIYFNNLLRKIPWWQWVNL